MRRCDLSCNANGRIQVIEGIGAGSPSRIPIGGLRFRSVDDHELVGEHAIGRAPIAIRPLHADLCALSRAEADVDKAGMARRVAAADVNEAGLGAGYGDVAYPVSPLLHLFPERLPFLISSRWRKG